MTEAPVPARYYPPDGEAHGHPVRLAWEAGTLLVLRDDGPCLRAPEDTLAVEARGFNHEQWALSWPEGGGRHLLIVADRDATPLKRVAPALFRPGERQRRAGRRRLGMGLALLVLLPLLLGGLLLLSLGPVADRVVDHIPPEVERQIGEAVLARTRAEGPLIEDGPAHAALQAIAGRLTRPGEKLDFYLARRPGINAFAAPGGVVVVNSALLEAARNAEEVAGVLAHEIAHVELRHSLHQLARSAGLRIIVAALFGDYGSLGGWAAQLGELKFSRDAEREADLRALDRLTETGIDPQGLPAFFETLSRQEGADGLRPPALL
ncbi:M48 family metallopeptidase, partial [Zoogloea sp.]|uniref:M48 family metallopeptidase n=1 Tax=Zoogloea sp. TaxID=49181 RepID=UPI001415DCAC